MNQQIVNRLFTILQDRLPEDAEFDISVLSSARQIINISLHDCGSVSIKRVNQNSGFPFDAHWSGLTMQVSPLEMQNAEGIDLATAKRTSQMLAGAVHIMEYWSELIKKGVA